MSPLMARATAVAITVATTSGMNERVRNSVTISSMAKMTPPSGALNAVVSAAAAPQPTMVRVSSTLSPMRCPTSEPKVEAIKISGPMRPSEKPVPMQMAAAAPLASATWVPSRARFTATASITTGTPCPRASAA